MPPNKALAHEPPRPPCVLENVSVALELPRFPPEPGRSDASRALSYLAMGRREAGSVIWLLSSSTTTGNRRPAMQGNGQAAQVAPTTRTWAQGCESRQLLRKHEPAGGVRTKGGSPAIRAHRPLCPLATVPREMGATGTATEDSLLQSEGSLGHSQGSCHDARILNVRGHTHVLSPR